MARPPRSQRLALLVRLAQQREQRAARALGRALDAEREAQRRSRELADYQLDYAAALQQAGRQGTGGATLRNYNAFIGQLQLAERHQQQALAQAGERVRQARRSWQAAYARQRMLQQLWQRARAQEAFLADKRLQREIDDRRRPDPSSTDSG